MYVIKRNGEQVVFDSKKIFNAITKAFEDVDGKITNKSNAITERITLKLAKKVDECPTGVPVETIQNWVEEELMASERLDVARSYIRYRYKREMSRNHKDEFMQAISEKLEAKNVENSNANVDESSFGGRVGEAANVLTKQYALDFCMSDMSKKNHLENKIYIHDLNAYAIGEHNCLSIPFDDLLSKGFYTRQTDVRPANSINTAFQLVAVIFQLQSLQQFGGVSATHLDWTMVPYVRKSFYKHYRDGMKYINNCDDRSYDELLSDSEKYSDVKDVPIDDYNFYFNQASDAGSFDRVYAYAMAMTEKEARQGAEGLLHNLNTLQSRSGNQLPFTSVNYGSCALPEGRMIIKAMLEASIDGNGKHHKTPIFPCSIFQLGKGINKEPGDPNYDLYRLALKSTSQRLYPNYANLDWTGNAGYDKNDPRTYFSTMGCRTANGWDINGLGQMKDGRGNICPVTVIMPTLAMEAKEKAEEAETEIIPLFMKILDKKIHEAKDMLLERFEYICSQNPASAKFMYENGLMAGYKPEEGIRSALSHGTLALGQIGLAETLQILIGTDHTTKEGMELAKQIEQLFKTRCAEFKEKYKLNFGVYMTPAESLCHTALKKFRDKYGVIENVSDRDYFTNSIHVPVWHQLSPFDKIDLESQLTGYSSAGCITYVELDTSVKTNIDALETIVNYAMDKDIPYFAINIPIDECNDCGYCDDMNDTCIECGGEHVTHLRRVTGYLTGSYKDAFNDGKIAETEERVKHVGYME